MPAIASPITIAAPARASRMRDDSPLRSRKKSHSATNEAVTAMSTEAACSRRKLPDGARARQYLTLSCGRAPL